MAKRGKVTATEVLLAEGIEWEIGGKVFTQRPLSIRRLGRVVSAVSGEIKTLMTEPSFAALLDMNLEEIPALQAAPVFLSVLSAAPESLARILATLLNAEDHADHIAEYATPVQALGIFETFLDQNEAATLLRLFFDLRGRVTSMTAARPETSTD